MLALITPNESSCHRSSEIWIFACAFRDTPPTRVARNVYHWRKRPADPGGRRFLRRNARRFLHKLWLPGGGKSKWNRECGAKAVNHVESKNQRYVQARILNRDILQRVGFARPRHIEQRAYLTLADHVFVVGPARSRTRGLAGGILHELANFFLERHFLQKLGDFFFEDR